MVGSRPLGGSCLGSVWAQLFEVLCSASGLGSRLFRSPSASWWFLCSVMLCFVKGLRSRLSRSPSVFWCLAAGGLLLLDYDLVTWLLLLERARCADTSC
ncbi:hypothetical protein MtrunA17_Chr7g0217281 [Medicago truncatula]|uniref:Transmembrane protein n=1 Tax=Medicago truncatula TaxID=3880 RepID=A0A396GUL0_MEDTR|nr:hypothetical protein MtrunA17_Chr7g0217281 [Medicago truncatula]